MLKSSCVVRLFLKIIFIVICGATDAKEEPKKILLGPTIEVKSQLSMEDPLKTNNAIVVINKVLDNSDKDFDQILEDLHSSKSQPRPRPVLGLDGELKFHTTTEKTFYPNQEPPPADPDQMYSYYGESATTKRMDDAPTRPPSNANNYYHYKVTHTTPLPYKATGIPMKPTSKSKSQRPTTWWSTQATSAVTTYRTTAVPISFWLMAEESKKTEGVLESPLKVNHSAQPYPHYYLDKPVTSPGINPGTTTTYKPTFKPAIFAPGVSNVNLNLLSEDKVALIDIDASANEAVDSTTEVDEKVDYNPFADLSKLSNNSVVNLIVLIGLPAVTALLSFAGAGPFVIAMFAWLIPIASLFILPDLSSRKR